MKKLFLLMLLTMFAAPLSLTHAGCNYDCDAALEDMELNQRMMLYEMQQQRMMENERRIQEQIRQRNEEMNRMYNNLYLYKGE